MRKSFLIITGLVIAAVIAEILSLVYIGISKGELFYDLPVVTVAGATDRQIVNKGFVIHPYFGFTKMPGKTVESVVVPNGRIQLMTGKSDTLPDWASLEPNNHGFWSAIDYPLHLDREKNYIVGVFGGSVAQWLTVQMGNYLEMQLARLPGLQGKQVHVVNFSNSGYKQPQQLLVLAYFLAIGQQFDLIINLDGFNEVALPEAENLPKGIHYSLPRSYPKVVSSMTSIADPDMIFWIAKGLELREQSNNWARMANQRLSASFYILASTLHARLQAEAGAHMLKPPPISESERDVFFTLGAGFNGDSVERQDDELVDVWVRSSLSMHEMAERNSAQYLHVLQSNQYYSEKTFSPRERRIALRPQHPYSQAVSRLYPELLKRSLDLVKEGVNFADATPIFDDVRAIIYADSCCHYNDRGNKLLVDFIVREFEAALPSSELVTHH